MDEQQSCAWKTGYCEMVKQVAMCYITNVYFITCCISDSKESNLFKFQRRHRAPKLPKHCRGLISWKGQKIPLNAVDQTTSINRVLWLHVKESLVHEQVAQNEDAALCSLIHSIGRGTRRDMHTSSFGRRLGLHSRDTFQSRVLMPQCRHPLWAEQKHEKLQSH